MDPTERIKLLERLLVQAIIHGNTREAEQFCLDGIILGDFAPPTMIDIDDAERVQLFFRAMIATDQDKALTILGSWLESADLLQRDRAVSSVDAVLSELDSDSPVKPRLIDLLKALVEREKTEWFKESVQDVIEDHT